MVVLNGGIVKSKLVVEAGEDYVVVDCMRINENNVHLIIDFLKFAPEPRMQGKTIHLINASKSLVSLIDRLGLSAHFAFDRVA